MRTRELRSRVRRGAKALGKTIADWFKPHRISLKRLDLKDACNCIVGQLDEKGFDTPSADGWTYSPGFGFDAPEDALGMDAPIGAADKAYAQLNTLWEEEIRARRGATV